MKPFSTVIIIAVLVILSGGCDRNRIYEVNSVVENDAWESGDFFRYTFTIADTAIPYHMFVNIRNSTDYPYANLFLFIRTILPDQLVATDTLDFQMADPDGRWLGRGIGKYRDLQVPLLLSFRFPQKGEYAFEFEHAMRDHELKGIAAVGIRIEKAGKE